MKRECGEEHTAAPERPPSSVEEKPNGLPVEAGELLKLDHVHAAIAALSPRDETLRFSEGFRRFDLRHASLAPRLAEARQELPVSGLAGVRGRHAA